MIGTVRRLYQNARKSLYRWLYADGMSQYYHSVSRRELLRMTRALLKFCCDYKYPGVQNVAALEACIVALEIDDFNNIDKAFAHFSSINWGKEGLGDWWPPVVYEHEDQEYVQAVFNALVERTYRLMHTAAGVPLDRRSRPKSPGQ